MLETILYPSVILISIISFVISNHIINRRKINLEIMKIFSDYMGILDYHLDKAFNIIYKEKIFIYSVEATKPSEEQYSAISRDFVALLIKILGPNLKNEFVKIYGNEETFLFNVLEYFSSKYESDEIRNEAINNLTQNEIEFDQTS